MDFVNRFPHFPSNISLSSTRRRKILFLVVRKNKGGTNERNEKI